MNMPRSMASDEVIVSTCAVTAYPAMRPNSGNRQRTCKGVKPSHLDRRFSSSMAFESVGVSTLLKYSIGDCFDWLAAPIQHLLLAGYDRYRSLDAKLRSRIRALQPGSQFR